MNDRGTEELKKLLQKSLPPVGKSEVPRDLWPAMLQQLSERRVRVPWWDWLLLAGATMGILAFPGTIGALLYHL